MSDRPGHEHFMRLAIKTAGQAMAAGNHPFGALLVYDDQILIAAQNTVVTERDVTRHAELNLVSQTYRIVGPDRLAECLLYTSTEPCAMCAGAIFWAGIGHVVYGCSGKTLFGYAGGDFDVSVRDLYVCNTLVV